jgi:uncharacterized membrane protein
MGFGFFLCAPCYYLEISVRQISQCAEIQALYFLKGDRMITNTIVGLFDHYSNADAAVKALQDYGLDYDRISVVTRDNDSIEPKNAGEKGAATGAVAGGLVGLMAGLSTLIIPGIGPVLATGTLASTLATTFGLTAVGATLGACTGSLLGAFVDLGFGEKEAEFYAEGVKRGGIVVSVEADPEDEDDIIGILRRTGAVDMTARRKIWLDEGWTSFDEEAAKSDEDAYRR